MSRFAYYFVLALTLSVCNHSPAEIIIQVGDHVLLPDTENQLIDIELFSSDPLSDSLLSGMELHVEIGDGSGAEVEPRFQGVEGTLDGVDFSSSVFSGNTPSGQAPVQTLPSVIDAAIITNSDVSPSGLLVSLLIDTTGFTVPGESFALRFGDHFSPFPTDTLLLGPVGNAAPVPITIENGTLTIFEPTGDFNNDAATDGTDFLLWQRAFQESIAPPGSGADADASGFIDNDDLAVWQMQYGSTSGAAEPVVKAVPEPSGFLATFVLLMLIAASTVANRKHLILSSREQC